MWSPRLTGVLLVMVSAASFGALGVLARVAYDDGAGPVGVLTFRFAIAAACFVVIRGLRRPPTPPPRAMAGLVVMGLCYLLQSLCFFTAVQHAPPGLVTLLLYLYPALVVVVGAAVLGEALSRALVIACVVAVAGTALIVGPSTSGGDPLGVVFGIAAAVVYSAYILLGSRVLRQADALTASTVIMVTAAAGFAAVFLATPHRPALPRTPHGWAAVVAIALLCTVVAGLTFLAGLARVGPATASTISTVEPVVSVALSALVVGEPITLRTVIGGTMVLASVVVLGRTTSTPKAEPAPAA